MRLEDLRPPERLPLAIDPCPIQEAVIELRYERPKGLIWDAVPGVVFSRLEGKGWGPLERLPIAEVPQEILEMEANLQHAPHYSLSKGPCLLLLGPKMLGLANKSPYLGWKQLFAEFRSIFEALGSTLIRKLNRVGIRYIDTGYSDEADHLFQSMSISRSDSCRSLVPIHADHRFQLNAIGA